MEKRNLLTIWAKRVFFAVALAGTAGLMLPACDKEPEYPDREPYEKILWFNAYNGDSIQPKIIKYFAGDKACTHIYLTLTEDARYDHFLTTTITNLRNALQERVNISDKVAGRGDFWFQRGEALPADSLWFVQHGWTVNQRQH
ncbi:MAG: hypothetical protein NC048_06430 [Bacteroides sp.]|nr:hypothetical protein [Ruminococcus flavefaciens]MCM1555114.1 hypothetical protein [Bacteroides sp.]